MFVNTDLPNLMVLPYTIWQRGRYFSRCEVHVVLDQFFPFFFLAFCLQIQHLERTRCEAGVVCMLYFLFCVCVCTPCTRCLYSGCSSCIDRLMMVLLFIDIERGTLRQNKNILLSFFRSLDVFLFTGRNYCLLAAAARAPSISIHLQRLLHWQSQKESCVLGFRRMVRILKDPLIIHGPALQYASYVVVSGTWKPRNAFLEWWSSV